MLAASKPVWGWGEALGFRKGRVGKWGGWDPAVTSTNGSIPLSWPGRPTRGCSIHHQRSSRCWAKKPHCGQWSFPRGKGTNVILVLLLLREPDSSGLGCPPSNAREDELTNRKTLQRNSVCTWEPSTWQAITGLGGNRLSYRNADSPYVRNAFSVWEWPNNGKKKLWLNTMLFPSLNIFKKRVWQILVKYCERIPFLLIIFRA